MSQPGQDTGTPSNRHWIRRVRALRDASERERGGVCYVEGIRQVLAAHEAGHPLEAVLIDPRRLRSTVAWRTISEMRSAGVAVVELSPNEFERISTRDNPVGIAAIIEWKATALGELTPKPDEFYLVTDGVADAGNLGTLIRTADSLGAAGIIIHAGVDPSHPNALRSSLGTAFALPIAKASSSDEVFEWARQHQITTVATSARASQPAWDVDLSGSVALLVGNEGEGLDRETIDRCDDTLMIPMSGTATSLNVGVAAGIILYEIQRQRSA